jgi:beta-lactamase class A
MMRTSICLLGMCAVLLVAPFGLHAGAVMPDQATHEIGDFDPVLLAFVAALLHVPNGPGMLHDITADDRAVTLRFAGAALTVPEGRPTAAMVQPLGERLLADRVRAPILPGSRVTYAMLDAAPRIGTTGSALLLQENGTLAAAPAALPLIDRVEAAGYRVPPPFAAFVTAATGSLARPEDVALAGQPLRDPVWIETAGAPRLVEPFTRRLLAWDPETDRVSAANVGDQADAAGIIPDGGPTGKLLAAITVRLVDAPVGVGVALQVGTPRGTVTASWDGAQRYSAASVIKLAIMAAYEDAIVHGEMERDPDMDGLEEDMIVYSDNDAANALIDLLGHPRINAVMQRLGMKDSIIGSHIEETADDDTTDDNYLVPREALLLMDALVRGDMGDVARIRDLLLRSQAPASIRDVAAFGIPIYEKRGWYDGVENDLFLIALPNGTTLTMAIFQSEVDDIDAAYALLADLALIAVTGLA